MKNVDSQVLHKNGFGFVYRPTRLLSIPDIGFVCLMHSVQDDTWLVFNVDANSIVKCSTTYHSKTFSYDAWSQLCEELTAKTKEHLADLALDDTLPGEERADAALEMARLELADDEKNEDITAKANEFVASHSPAEVETYIASELAAYRERRASQEEA